MNMDKALVQNNDVNRLYIPRKERGRGLMSGEDVISLTILEFENYVKNFYEQLLTVARKVDGYVEVRNVEWLQQGSSVWRGGITS